MYIVEIQAHAFLNLRGYDLGCRIKSSNINYWPLKAVSEAIRSSRSCKLQNFPGEHSSDPPSLVCLCIAVARHSDLELAKPHVNCFLRAWSHKTKTLKIPEILTYKWDMRETFRQINTQCHRKTSYNVTLLVHVQQKVNQISVVWSHHTVSTSLHYYTKLLTVSIIWDLYSMVTPCL